MIRSRSRALDWTCAAMILTWGVTLLLPGDTLASSPAYIEFIARAPEGFWAWACIAIGGARFAALIINGHWPGGSPVMRGGAAVLGAVVWTQFAFAFIVASAHMGVVSLGVPVALCMAGADLFSCSRAGSDMVRARRRVHGTVV